DLAEKYPKRVAIVPEENEGKRKIYAAADMIFIPADSTECIEEAKNAMAYGAIPIMAPQNFAEDYDPVQEKGSAFFYTKESPWSFFASFVRALENFRFPYDWKNIQINAMEA
ncbi:MAG: hypothetical protein V1760_00580, partial [Candidatus Peregrinibacteria bacterium]